MLRQLPLPSESGGSANAGYEGLADRSSRPHSLHATPLMHCAGSATPRPRYECANPGQIIHININSLVNSAELATASPATVTARARPVASVGNTLTSPSTTIPTSPASTLSGRKEGHGAYYRILGATVDRVMTDNGSCYSSFACARVQTPRHPPHPHQTLHTADQWQGRTLHSNDAPRMGLRHCIPTVRSAPR